VSHGTLTARAVWVLLLLASLLGMLLAAVIGLWFLIPCVAVALLCLAVAVIANLLMGDDDADD
jgi:hypothetical protein